MSTRVFGNKVINCVKGITYDRGSNRVKNNKVIPSIHGINIKY